MITKFRHKAEIISVKDNLIMHVAVYDSINAAKRANRASKYPVVKEKLPWKRHPEVVVKQAK